ncbi:zinc ABC transporter substrate-binding protein [Castellaniella sp. MT123]|uniref:metal ABC transporter solute-binding protein, Zn/Mn family n=1 Tax=Castellaniella sp. MT123 TaxID=3140381 RepID=UPI0031F4742A
MSDGFRVRRAGLWAGIGLCLWLALQSAAFAQAAASGAVPAAGREDRLRVVASFSILGDMTREVGGDDIHLDVLIGPMREAHTFEPSPRDARALGAAQVLVLNGLGLEAWMPRLLEASDFKGREIVASHGVKTRLVGAGESEDAAPGTVDPHAWQDLANGVQYVRNIAQGLAQADPTHESAYLARADAYVQKLRQADAQWRQQLAAIPEDRRALATSHDAFGYLGAAYGIRILSLVGLSSEAEPSARAMADLLKRIRADHVRALFLEQGGNSRALEQLAQEAGVTMGGTLYADTLDRPGHEASTYLGMFRWNTQQLMKAFTASGH